MDKIYELIKNCLLEVEYQDEQWNDIRTAELITEKVEKLMLDYTKFLYLVKPLQNKETMNKVMLNEFLSQYKLALFKP